MLSRPIALILAAMAAVTVNFEANAGFKRDRGYNGLEQGYVIAKSRFGNGSVKGAVRTARNGLQVQLPSGDWLYCRSTCSETLRVEVLDMFEYQGELKGYGTFSQECGIFGCLGATWEF